MVFSRAVIAPNLTPFNADLSPDTALYVSHAKQLLASGCDALAPFGTTGEAASLGMQERMLLLEALVTGGINPERLIPGTGLTALSDTIGLCRHACDLGVAGVMVLPPFYFKDIKDEGLAQFYARLIEGVNRPGLRIFLYHIPPVARVGFSVALVRRLARDFAGTVIGIKDSSGDWENTAAMLAGAPDLMVFPGNELGLRRALAAGAPGCITATANVNAPAISALANETDESVAEMREAEVESFRLTIQRFGAIPAMKAMLARRDGYAGWSRVRPPLLALDSASLASLEAGLEMKI